MSLCCFICKKIEPFIIGAESRSISEKKQTLFGLVFIAIFLLPQFGFQSGARAAVDLRWVSGLEIPESLLPIGYKYDKSFTEHYRQSVEATLSDINSVYELKYISVSWAPEKPVAYPGGRAAFLPTTMGADYFIWAGYLGAEKLDHSNLPKTGPHLLYPESELVKYDSVAMFDFRYLKMKFRHKKNPQIGEIKVFCSINVNELVLNDRHPLFENYGRLISGHTLWCGRYDNGPKLIENLDLEQYPEWGLNETVALAKGLEEMPPAQHWILRRGVQIDFAEFFEAVRAFRAYLYNVAGDRVPLACDRVDQHMVQLNEFQVRLLVGLEGKAYDKRFSQSNQLIEKFLQVPGVDKCLRPKSN